MNRDAEQDRLSRLIRRDGEEEARQWAQRTAAIYRGSVLNRDHFAHAGEYRRKFIESYLAFKRFAARGAAQST